MSLSSADGFHQHVDDGEKNECSVKAIIDSVAFFKVVSQSVVRHVLYGLLWNRKERAEESIQSISTSHTTAFHCFVFCESIQSNKQYQDDRIRLDN